MNNTFFQKNKKAISIAIAIFAFAVISWAYFYPVLQGKRVKQHDMEMQKGMAQELTQYRESTGETALWTNSAFGGMPAWNISAPQKTNLFQYVHKVLSIGLPSPLGSVFICMLGFFILLLVLDVGVWASAIGAIAYGFTSYLYIIIGAGHNGKAVAMAYMAPVIAGVLLTYKGKYLWGMVLTAIALSLELFANHLQITYYLLLILVIIIIAEFIQDIIQKKLVHFFKASGMLAAVAVVSILTFSTRLYANYEFGKETTRGKPVLASDDANQTKGLERDYITAWSYGKGETWSLMIPNIKGGASEPIGKENQTLNKEISANSEIAKDINKKAGGNPDLAQLYKEGYKFVLTNTSTYWGDQPGTSGPVYVGAIVVFLFVLGALTVKGKLKWALLAATLLSILLSWGKNFMGFTDFFLDYIPGYDKFRAVSMTLVIAEVCIPLLGFLGLAEIVKNPEYFKQNLKKFYIALGITAGLCIVFYLAPSSFFSFIGIGDDSYINNNTKYFQNIIYQQYGIKLELNKGIISSIINNGTIHDIRIEVFRKDVLRSLLFILLSAVPIFLYGKGKLKGQIAFPILAVLVLLDMFPIAQRYLNSDNFIDKAQAETPFIATSADKRIMRDNSLDYRVLDLTGSPFNDARCSYFHKSIGGYSGAKLRRYQDIIDHYLVRFDMNVLNMLNTKYIISSKNNEPVAQINPEAFGNAWIANDIKWVETPNAEIDAIGTTDLKHTAIVHKEFEKEVGSYHPSNSEGSITLMDYKPNQLTYHFEANEDKLVVFSEIWTSKGWTMQIDGQEHPILRANYLLRAAMVPAGQHEIVMRYEPKIWKVGGILSFISSLAILLAAAGALYITLKKKKESTIG